MQDTTAIFCLIYQAIFREICRLVIRLARLVQTANQCKILGKCCVMCSILLKILQLHVACRLYGCLRVVFFLRHDSYVCM